MTRSAFSVHYFYAFFLLLLLSNCGTPATTATSAGSGTTATDNTNEEDGSTTFILVRHGEKEYGAHPHLRPEGVERAERLSFMLDNVDLTAIYATPTYRAMETAEPTAEKKGLKIREYDSTQLKLLAKQMLRRHRGGTVLVSGHSNTTPELTSHLMGEESFVRFSELDYTNFYVVTVPANGPPTLLKLRY